MISALKQPGMDLTGDLSTSMPFPQSCNAYVEHAKNGLSYEE